MNDVFEELIQTIERNAVNNTNTIIDVKLWAAVWRERRNKLCNPQPCDVCNGSGEFIDSVCSVCGGSGIRQ